MDESESACAIAQLIDKMCHTSGLAVILMCRHTVTRTSDNIQRIYSSCAASLSFCVFLCQSYTNISCVEIIDSDYMFYRNAV